jgi:hypothetical protein
VALQAAKITGSLTEHFRIPPYHVEGGVFYGFAGFGHIREKKNLLEKVAMYSDLFMFSVMFIYFVLKI